MKIFDSPLERLVVVIMLVLLLAAGLAITLITEQLYTSKDQAQQYGSTITTSINRLDSTVNELVIENRAQERIIDRQHVKATGSDSAYYHLRLEHRRLQMKHRTTLHQLRQTRKKLDESVRNQRITVPTKPLDRLTPGDSAALPSPRR